ncbi:MAG: lipoyl synthase [Candidatus Saccharimonadaceae bacterium]
MKKEQLCKLDCSVNKPREVHIKKPDWLKVKLGVTEGFTKTNNIVQSNSLHTICSSGRCPNMGECWDRGTATFMIGGEICTRSCKFCNTKTGMPMPLDKNEPVNVANSIKLMSLKHAVITSVDRDDLSDLGAEHWVKTIEAIRYKNPTTTIEILIPDFQGKTELIDIVCAVRPDVMAHNMETVRRLTPEIRSAARYGVSIKTLSRIAENGIFSKSGIMLGLGETKDEICELMDNLLAVNCKSLTIGQYLQPTRKHYPVKEYIHPDIFIDLKNVALSKGFKTVVSGPLVRSSYHAEISFNS